MKKNTHPKYYSAKVTCACGNTFQIGSTLETIQVDICSACHPFFTGQQKYVDTQGRVEKFMKKRETAKNYVKKNKKSDEAPSDYTPKTLKEMLSSK